MAAALIGPRPIQDAARGEPVPMPANPLAPALIADRLVPAEPQPSFFQRRVVQPVVNFVTSTISLIDTVWHLLFREVGTYRQRLEHAFFSAVLDSNLPRMQALLTLGVNINTTNRDRNTPLREAVRVVNIDVVRFLIAAHANLEARDRVNNTALITATLRRNPEIVRLLIDAGANVNATNNVRSTALIKASKRGNIEIVRRLIAVGADVNAFSTNGTTPLIQAGLFGDEEIVRSLIAAGANVNAADIHGNTALIQATRSVLARRQIDQNMYTEIIRELLGAGASPHPRVQVDRRALSAHTYLNDDGLNALEIARRDNREAIVREIEETIVARAEGWNPERHIYFPRQVRPEIEALMIAWQSQPDGTPWHPESSLHELPLELIFVINGFVAADAP